MRWRQALTAHLDAEMGHRDPDCNFICANFERSVGADAIVGSQDEEYAHRDCVTGARDYDRRGKGQHPMPQLESHRDHLLRVGAARGKHLQIEPSGEGVRPSCQHYYRAVGDGPIQRIVQRRQHCN